MIKTYLLTVMLYEDSVFGIMNVISHACEFIKDDLKSSGKKLSSTVIDTTYKEIGVIDSESLRAVRNVFVHQVNNIRLLRESVANISVSDLLYLLAHYNVDVDTNLLHLKIQQTIEYLDSII